MSSLVKLSFDSGSKSILHPLIYISHQPDHNKTKNIGALTWCLLSSVTRGHWPRLANWLWVKGKLPSGADALYVPPASSGWPPWSTACCQTWCVWSPSIACVWSMQHISVYQLRVLQNAFNHEGRPGILLSIDHKRSKPQCSHFLCSSPHLSIQNDGVKEQCWYDCLRMVNVVLSTLKVQPDNFRRKSNVSPQIVNVLIIYTKNTSWRFPQKSDVSLQVVNLLSTL